MDLSCRFLWLLWGHRAQRASKQSSLLRAYILVETPPDRAQWSKMEKTHVIFGSLLGTKMFKDLENTELMASHFLEKRRIKVTFVFKSASFEHYKWPFLENFVSDICLYKSSNWSNWPGHTPSDIQHTSHTFPFVIPQKLLSYVKIPPFNRGWQFTLTENPGPRLCGRRVSEPCQVHTARQFRAREQAMFLRTKLASSLGWAEWNTGVRVGKCLGNTRKDKKYRHHFLKDGVKYFSAAFERINGATGKGFFIHWSLINDECSKYNWHTGEVVTKTSILITLHLAK